MEQFRQSLYDGVTEQVLCTLGLLKTVNGEKFRTVSQFIIKTVFYILFCLVSRYLQSLFLPE